MNFIDTVIFGSIFSACVVVLLLSRDLWHHRAMTEKIKNTSKKIFGILTHRHYPFFKKEIFAIIIIGVLLLGICLAFYARFIEVRWLQATHTEYDLRNNTTTIKIAWLSDLQVGNHKKDEWAKKIVEKIETENPDLVILGGDIVDNEGSFVDETVYLGSFSEIFKKYPTYYILGNHEYGIGNASRDNSSQQTANRVREVEDKMKEMGTILLKNKLDCPEIKGQKICLYGIDEIWANDPKFKELNNWPQWYPIILLTHNPDGLLYWPENYPLPDLTLAGHTHGGQVWLPIVGPLGNAGITIGEKYYRGAQKYGNSDIYISVGAGESGGSLRFGARPELSIITVR